MFYFGYEIPIAEVEQAARETYGKEYSWPKTGHTGTIDEHIELFGVVGMQRQLGDPYYKLIDPINLRRRS